MSEDIDPCSLPAIQPLMAVFDAALAPIEPYIDFIFDQASLDPDTIALISGQILSPPTLPGIIQALKIAEVIIAMADLPPMPALTPLPALGNPLLTYGDWDINLQGEALVNLVLTMITIPLDLVVGTLLGSPPAFPDIIIDSLPDIPGAPTLAECIEAKLPMFG